jgi:hypothetical protein
MRLDYFGVHGRGIFIRLIFNYCNIKFQDNFLTFDQFMQRKAKTPHLQLPLLVLNDGT